MVQVLSTNSFCLCMCRSVGLKKHFAWQSVRVWWCKRESFTTTENMRFMLMTEKVTGYNKMRKSISDITRLHALSPQFHPRHFSAEVDVGQMNSIAVLQGPSSCGASSSRCCGRWPPTCTCSPSRSWAPPRSPPSSPPASASSTSWPGSSSTRSSSAPGWVRPARQGGCVNTKPPQLPPRIPKHDMVYLIMVLGTLAQHYDWISVYKMSSHTPLVDIKLFTCSDN